MRDEWYSLDALRSVALRNGCTPAQFAHAVEAMGDNPNDVAAYLYRKGFLARDPREAVPPA